MSGYVRDGAEIYRRSFATIRAEADLDGLDPILERVVVRMIHACGMVDLVDRRRGLAGLRRGGRGRAARRRADPLRHVDGRVGRHALAPARGQRRRLHAVGPVVPALAAELGTTRTAAAMELWRERLGGSVVVVGNAPTALFRLLELVEQGVARPAAVIGVPVGFIGAAESKAALAAHPAGVGVPRRPRPARRQRDRRRRRQRAGERGRMSAATAGRLFSASASAPATRSC